jgi:hypothetical protein
MVQSKLSGPVRRAYQAQENDHSEYRDARDNDHEHPRRFRIARTNAAILPGGLASVNGTKDTLVSVLRYRVPQVHDQAWRKPEIATRARISHIS